MRDDLLRCIRLRGLINVVYLGSKANAIKRKVRIIKLDGDYVRRTVTYANQLEHLRLITF